MLGTRILVRRTAVVPPGRAPGAKRPTNVSLPEDLLQAARCAEINLSALLERALTEELVVRKRCEWRVANAAAIARYNDHLRQEGAFSCSRRSF